MTLTKQEILNQTFGHILIQGYAKDTERGCAYRTKEGKSCGVGYWLNDTDAKKLDQADDLWDAVVYPSICSLRLALTDEESTVEDIKEIEAILSRLPDTDLTFWEAIQHAHDDPSVRNEPFQEYVHHMIEVALRFNLEMPYAQHI